MAGFKTVLGVLSIVMLFFGTIFILQGLNVSGAPQSYMTSDINWTYRGVGLDIVGLALFIFAVRGGWRNILGGIGGLLSVFGALWIAQGLNVLPGMGAMSGHQEWAIRGGIALAIGLVAAFFSHGGSSE
ncbi:MAG: hypothetical protein QM759_02735 [Terricaulis sp.]